MRYQTPQFIDIEDKVIGPFSFKQFVYLAGSGGLGYALFRLLPLLIAIPLIVAVVTLGLSLAFYKVNNRPFIFFIQSFITFNLRNKFYLWRKPTKKPEVVQEKKEVEHEQETLRPSKSKLQQLSWSLDVLDIDAKHSEEQK